MTVDVGEQPTLGDERNLHVVLIAPHISEQMGGEAMKALRTFEGIARKGLSVTQITHERVKKEFEGKDLRGKMLFIKDDWAFKFLWKIPVAKRWLMETLFLFRAARCAQKIVDGKRRLGAKTIVHFTEPNSPAVPVFLVKNCINIMGPVNGNIYYPPAFRRYEALETRVRRTLHRFVQSVNQVLFPGRTRADYLLVAGGERTKKSLRWAGCRDDQFAESLDCGISDSLFERPRICHQGVNRRFVYNGRLVFHKGMSFLIQSLLKTKHPIELDIIGKGSEKKTLIRMVEKFKLTKRVRFLDWFEKPSDLHDAFFQYRGFMMPSLEDANGIVVQEAMALGLPPVCLDWGGPQLLITKETGILIKPVSESFIIGEMAKAMDLLSEDSVLAENMSIKGRERARAWRWSKLIDEWVNLYLLALKRKESMCSSTRA